MIRFGERGGDVKEWRVIVGGAVVVHQDLVRLDAVVGRHIGIVDAVRAMHRVAPAAPGVQILAVRGQREAARSPPFRDLLRDSPRIPYRTHRRVVDTCEVDLVRAISIDHRVLPLPWASVLQLAWHHGRSTWRSTRCPSCTDRGGPDFAPTGHGLGPLQPGCSGTGGTGAAQARALPAGFSPTTPDGPAAGPLPRPRWAGQRSVARCCPR